VVVVVLVSVVEGASSWDMVSFEARRCWLVACLLVPSWLRREEEREWACVVAWVLPSKTPPRQREGGDTIVMMFCGGCKQVERTTTSKRGRTRTRQTREPGLQMQSRAARLVRSASISYTNTNMNCLLVVPDPCGSRVGGVERRQPSTQCKRGREHF